MFWAIALIQFRDANGPSCHDLVVRQAHHEVYYGFAEFTVDLTLSLSKGEVVMRFD